MPYARISGTRFGAAAIRYALGGEDEKGHNNNKVRNQYITGVNMLPGESEPYDKQMNRYWRRAAARNKVQVRRIIISFSRNELDPDNPESILKAAQICTEFVTENYPGRQALICIQTDGKGGLVHGHILVNNVSMEAGTVKDALVRDHKDNNGKWVYVTRDVTVPSGRGCIDAQTNHNFVEQRAREVTERYIDIDRGKENKQHTTQTEQAKREKGEYVYKDDLRERIQAARDEAADYDDFLKRLSAHGVRLNRQGTSKKHGDYLTYELADVSRFDPASPDYDPNAKPPKSFQCRSYKLGDDCCPDAIKQAIQQRVTCQPVQTVQIQQPVRQNVPPITRGSMTATPSYSPAQQPDGFPNFGDWAADTLGYQYDPDTFMDFYEQHKNAYNAAKAAAAKSPAQQPQTPNKAVQNAPPVTVMQNQDAEQNEDERRGKAARRRAQMEQQREDLKHTATAERDKKQDAILKALEHSAAVKQLDQDPWDKQLS